MGTVFRTDPNAQIMTPMNNLSVTVMRFTEGYEHQSFYKKRPHLWLDLGDIPGTGRYCDDQAQEEILRRIQGIRPGGVHFLDSGNYHYVTYLWMKRIQEPFWLLVFDHHTDMQEPAFGDLLSCGGWVERALRENPFLQGVTLVGPENLAFEQTDLSLRQRVRFFGREDWSKEDWSKEDWNKEDGVRKKAFSPAPSKSPSSRKAFFGHLEELSAVPSLYISLDKDVFGTEDALTDWDQGDMALEEFLDILGRLLRERKRLGRGLLGFDICGDGKDLGEEEGKVNDRTNERILDACIFFWEEEVTDA